MANYTTELEALNAIYDLLETKLDALHADVDGVESIIGLIKTNTDDANTKLDIVNTKLTTLHSDVDGVEGKLDTANTNLTSIIGETVDVRNVPTDACIIRVYVGDITAKREKASEKVTELLAAGYRPYMVMGISEDLARVLFVKYPAPNDTPVI